jgi:hypothetical protein
MAGRGCALGLSQTVVAAPGAATCGRQGRRDSEINFINRCDLRSLLPETRIDSLPSQSKDVVRQDDSPKILRI